MVQYYTGTYQLRDISTTAKAMSMLFAKGDKYLGVCSNSLRWR